MKYSVEGGTISNFLLHVSAATRHHHRVKGKLITLRARCGPEGRQRYSSTLP